MVNPISQPHPASRSAGMGRSSQGPWARYLNAALGAWLFVSAFVWLHSPGSRTNTWIVGVLMVIAALSAITASAMRWANTVLAIWLFVATLVIPHATVGTVWNNVIVAVLVFLLSLVPNASSVRHA